MIKNKSGKIILIGLMICIFSVVFVDFVNAQVADGKHIIDSGAQSTISKNIAQFLSWIGLGLAKFLGWITSKAIELILFIFSDLQNYNIAGVTEGWTVIRDVCNMFFILILLIIAFGAILRIENYNVKRLLPKLLIMAVLINFSKTICFLFIDFSNLVMFTFSRSFTGAGDGNFIQMLGLQNLLSISAQTDIELESWGLLSSIWLADMVLLLSAIILIMFIIVLLARIIIFWVLIVLSPIAYLASVLPATAKYASQWWGEFTKQLIIGPLIAFFLWLAFTITANLSVSDQAWALGPGAEAQDVIDSISAMGDSKNLWRYILGVGLLIGALSVSRGVGAMGSGAGMAMANNLRNRGMNLGRKGYGLGKGVVKKTFRGGADIGVGAVSRSKRVKGALARIGASKVPVIRSMATKGYVGLGARERAMEENEKKFVGSIEDRRLLGRIANGRAVVTPKQRARREAARNRAPSLISDSGTRQQQLNKMNRDELRNLSDSEWRSVGQSGARLRGNALQYAQKNSNERGSYNVGRLLHLDGVSQADSEGMTSRQVQGRMTAQLSRMNNADRSRELAVGLTFDDQEMNPATHRSAFGVLPGYQAPISGSRMYDPNINEFERLTSKGQYAHRYKTDREEATRDNILKQRRENYSNFGNGKSNMIISDFNNLRQEGLKNLIPKPEEHRGVSYHDSGEINRVAKGLMGAVENRIKGINSGKIKPRAKNELKSLESARERLSKPEELNNLQLVHTTSKRGDIAHEIIHGAGAETEEATEKIESKVVAGKTKLADYRRASIGRTKTPEEIVKLESGKEREREGDEGQRKEIISEKIETIETKEIKEIIKDKKAAETLNNPAKASNRDLLYSLRMVAKGLTGLSSAQQKLAKGLSINEKAQEEKGEKVSRIELETPAKKIIEIS